MAQPTVNSDPINVNDRLFSAMTGRMVTVISVGSAGSFHTREDTTGAEGKFLSEPKIGRTTAPALYWTDPAAFAARKGENLSTEWVMFRELMAYAKRN